MFKNKTLSMLAAVAFAFLGCMLYLIFTAEADAAQVRDGVLRFHIVANSDSDEDQRLKLKVRDGIALLTDQLFADAKTKQQAITTAQQHKEEIVAAATEILRQNGSDQKVHLEVKNLYFPTKRYENVSFPAGNYDAIHITLGEGKGKNIWCVMFPGLCVPSVSKDNKELLSGVMDEETVEMVTRPYSFKFKAVELWGMIKNWFS